MSQPTEKTNSLFIFIDSQLNVEKCENEIIKIQLLVKNKP